jgi:hypothetical protein
MLICRTNTLSFGDILTATAQLFSTLIRTSVGKIAYNVCRPSNVAM